MKHFPKFSKTFRKKVRLLRFVSCQFSIVVFSAGILLLFPFSFKSVKAQRNTVISGQEFLAFNQTHQVIFLRSLINSQRQLIEACASNLTEEELVNFLSQWLRNHPQNLSRPAHLAFTQALSDRCRENNTSSTQESSSDLSIVEPDFPEISRETQRESFEKSIINKTKNNFDSLPSLFFTETAKPAQLLGEPITIKDFSKNKLRTKFRESTEELNPISEANFLSESDPASSEVAFPFIEGVLKIDLLYFNLLESTIRNNEFSDLFTDTVLNANLFVTEEIYFNTAWRFQPAIFPPRRRISRYFEDHALRLGALNVNYETSDFYIGLGKGTTFFSMAFRSAPGIWGRDIAERDIRVPVRVGLATSGTIRTGATGNHALSGGTFFLDTSVLNEPFFTTLGRPRLRNGGPSNTRTPESFFIALDSTDIEALPGLRTHAAFMRQQVNRIQPRGASEPLPRELIDDEYRMALAAQWPLKVNEDITVTPLIEYAQIWNASGLRNVQRRYLTTTLQVFQGNWNWALASTLWWVDNRDNPRSEDFTNLQFQVSGGYTFENGVGIDIGYRFLELDKEGTHTFGVWLNYLIGF